MGVDNSQEVPIVGVWKVKSFEVQAADGSVVHPFGENPQGSIIYTKSGRYSAQLMRAGRPLLESGDQMQGTPEEIAANFQGVISYFGAYEFDHEESLVTHHVESSLFPNWEGQPQKRFVELSGDQLTLSTPPTVFGGEIVAVVHWERIG